IVTGAVAALEDAQIAAGTRAVTGTKFDEQLADRLLVAQTRECEAPIGDAVDLGHGDQGLRHTAQLLGLRQGGADQFVLDQRGGHVLEHGFAVAGRAVELASGFHVAHGGTLSLYRYEKPAPVSGFPRLPAYLCDRP